MASRALLRGPRGAALLLLLLLSTCALGCATLLPTPRAPEVTPQLEAAQAELQAQQEEVSERAEQEEQAEASLPPELVSAIDDSDRVFACLDFYDVPLLAVETLTPEELIARAETLKAALRVCDALLSARFGASSHMLVAFRAEAWFYITWTALAHEDTRDLPHKTVCANVRQTSTRSREAVTVITRFGGWLDREIEASNRSHPVLTQMVRRNARKVEMLRDTATSLGARYMENCRRRPVDGGT